MPTANGRGDIEKRAMGMIDGCRGRNIYEDNAVHFSDLCG
jgi:hypothetical protein